MKTQLFKFACLIICLLTIAPNCHAGSKWKAKHVVLIGLDGWGAYSVEKANIPHIKQLMNDGSYTLTKRSVLPSSSAVNWASMFMGAGPELHGYTTWNSSTPDLPSKELSKDGIFQLYSNCSGKLIRKLKLALSTNGSASNIWWIRWQ